MENLDNSQINNMDVLNSINKQTGGGAISIVIPIYNGRNYIDNIFNNFKDFLQNAENSLIFIDDGSKDDSYRYLTEKSSYYKNIHVLHKENGGIASARNAGLKLADSKYIVFMDQDDRIDVDLLLKNLELLENNNADFLVADHCIVNNQIERKCGNIYGKSVIEGGDLKRIAADFMTTHCAPCKEILVKHNVKFISPTVWNCIYNLDFLKRNRISFFSFVDFEDDFIFMVQCLCAANKIVTSDVAFYKWYIIETSESHTSKYIQNFQEKRSALNAWLYDKAVGLNIDNSNLKLFKNFLYTSALRGGYTSVCSVKNKNNFSAKRRELKEIAAKPDKEVKVDFTHTNTAWSLREKIAMNLIRCHLYGCAILMDKFYKLLKR
ncbi:TPA: glycosyltransferase [Candidatus Scatousia excrementigallinarum]|uniref:Glycosyltransferase n=1 Tax=Candidatus Scatousia excrementigallinarum TaxID=2840935 RepID=A0A9D1EYU3_9BACT|nr:glycosyltransferase [Candidatus Scatousia excrementigallinarum]